MAEINKEYASKGLAGTALGFGIGGTALGLGALANNNNNNNCCGNNGGILGNLFGNNCNNNNCVSQRELAYATELASCKSDRYSDQVARAESERVFQEARRIDEKIAGVVKDTTDALIKTGVALGELTQTVKCQAVEIERNREEARNYTDTRVNAEAQLRKSADDNIAAWTQGELNKKIDGSLVLKGSDICYDGCKPVLERCPCGSEQDPYNVRVMIEQAVKSAVRTVMETK